ncbi:MAG: hypothetical protein ACJAYH_002616 [Celeribacter sp.]|jgi:hypothetical protein
MPANSGGFVTLWKQIAPEKLYKLRKFMVGAGVTGLESKQAQG